MMNDAFIIGFTIGNLQKILSMLEAEDCDKVKTTSELKNLVALLSRHAENNYFQKESK